MTTGFFTQGIEFALPHPPIPQRTILLLCAVIRQAWQLLATKPPAGFNPHTADEDAITLELVDIIESRLRQSGEVDGFDHARFGKVIRGPEIANFNKKHPDKRPDIFFDLKRENYPIYSTQDGLFVECKPVDRKHSVSKHYCERGLKRFVIGDYAWAMQDAMMVGYVANGYSFQNLATALDDPSSTYLNTASHGAQTELAVYRSHHNRDFAWLENHGSACPISVTHLWLQI